MNSPHDDDCSALLKAAFVQDAADPCMLRMALDADGRRHTIDFKSADVGLVPRGDALAACTLIPAMNMGWRLCLSAPISRHLAANLPRLQEIHRCWLPELQPVQIDASKSTELPAHGKRVALFFTGGVDSCYSLLKHREALTDLVFVHGFDVARNDSRRCAQVEQRLREIAAAFGKGFIKVETNLRDWLEPHGSWGAVTHGSALAAVAHLLPAEFSSVYIASSDTYLCLVPWGSHPVSDPLWSSDNLSIVHDGCEVDRHQKVRSISGHPSILKILRVCWKNEEEHYNCGRCEKCLRTMIDLRLAGVLDACSTFDQPLSLWRVAMIKEPWRGVIGDFLRVMKSHRGHHALRFAMRLAFLRNRIRQAFK